MARRILHQRRHLCMTAIEDMEHALRTQLREHGVDVIAAERSRNPVVDVCIA
jgi:hypothetical protein